MRELYEQKLERANSMYMELTACMLQLEKRERELIRYVIFSNIINIAHHCHVTLTGILTLMILAMLSMTHCPWPRDLPPHMTFLSIDSPE